MEALQTRIRPHFLFDSMNTRAALIPLDPVAAERTVEDLRNCAAPRWANTDKATARWAMS